MREYGTREANCPNTLRRLGLREPTVHFRRPFASSRRSSASLHRPSATLHRPFATLHRPSARLHSPCVGCIRRSRAYIDRSRGHISHRHVYIRRLQAYIRRWQPYIRRWKPHQVVCRRSRNPRSAAPAAGVKTHKACGVGLLRGPANLTNLLPLETPAPPQVHARVSQRRDRYGVGDVCRVVMRITP